MFKVLLKKANVLKDLFGHYVPKPIKNEVKFMKKGMNSLIERYDTNYGDTYLMSKIRGKTPVEAAEASMISAFSNMHIKRAEIPAATGLVAGLLPIPGASGVGYAIARVATCNKAMAAYHTGGKALKNIYSRVGGALKI